MMDRNQKNIIILVGPKGAGKTTIGSFLASDCGIYFLAVEPLFIAIREKLGANHPDYEKLGFESVLTAIERAIHNHDSICFESTGTSSFFAWLLSELRKIACVRLVHVKASPKECLRRIKSRDSSIHIPVSDEDIARIYSAAERVHLTWDIEIDTELEFNEAVIRETIDRLMTQIKND